MSHLVLARKYRPKSFTEMMGQMHVLRALQNALDRNQLHHAYLFTGTRGVGKTTVARILAKCLNCERGISSNPCGECTACQEINQGRHIDLLEIDAASRTKVEDTRELLENVQYSPQHARYKIYLIDEVHMLSGHSFNALLKTLEEPPPHVIFLLATTDPEKLPATVLSRCLQLHLKNMTADQIVSQLKIIAEKENIKTEEEALKIIAKAGNGSMRDALSLFDQAIAYSNDIVTENDVIQMLGVSSEQTVIELLSLLASLDADALINKINTLENQGVDFLTLLNDILETLQKIAVAQVLQKADEDIKTLAETLSPEDIQLYYQIALTGKRDLPLAPDPKSGFVMTLVRMIAFTPQKTPTISKLTQHNSSVSNIKIETTTQKSSAPPSSWETLLPSLNLTGVAQLLAQNLALKEQKENHFEFILDENQSALLTPAAKERLIKAIETYHAKPCKVDIQIGKSSIESPAKIQDRKAAEKKTKAHQQLMADKNIQSLVNTFSANLEPDSVIITD